MEGYNTYRHLSNHKEKEIHDKFIQMFKRDSSANRCLSAIIFGWKNGNQTTPNRYLTDDEENICLSIIQWLGSPVGQGFLSDCGFELKK